MAFNPVQYAIIQNGVKGEVNIAVKGEFFVLLSSNLRPCAGAGQREFNLLCPQGLRSVHCMSACNAWTPIYAAVCVLVSSEVQPENNSMASLACQKSGSSDASFPSQLLFYRLSANETLTLNGQSSL